MTRLFTVLFTLTIVTACNGNNKKIDNKAAGNEKAVRDSNNNQENTRIDTNGKENDSNRSYKWTAKEQKKFLRDCKRDSRDHLSVDKLDEFCLCMLTESQKYYLTYGEMEAKSNEDDDRKIIEKCSGFFDEDE